MALSVHCRRVSHPNLVIENLDASVRLLEDIYGGSFMSDLPGPNWHACLIEVGGMIFELFEPLHFMLHSRVGPHYLGIEFEADMDEARAAVASHGVRIMRDIGDAFHTDPFYGFGVDFEFYGGTFFGPDALFITNFTKSAEYWRNHPIGYTGFVGYTHAVIDIEQASRFLQGFLGAKPVYEAERTAFGARVIGLKIADNVCELVSPNGDGVLMREMMTTGHGIRSCTFGVADIGKTRAHFDSLNLRVVEGMAPGSITVDPRDSLGMSFEFREQG